MPRSVERASNSSSLGCIAKVIIRPVSWAREQLFAALHAPEKPLLSLPSDPYRVIARVSRRQLRWQSSISVPEPIDDAGTYLLSQISPPLSSRVFCAVSANKMIPRGEKRSTDTSHQIKKPSELQRNQSFSANV